MDKLICVDRQRDKQGNIVNYVIMNMNTGEYVNLAPSDIRRCLKEDVNNIVNLALSSNDRILLVKDKFQQKVDNNNQTYKNNKLVQIDIESCVDKVLEKIIEYNYTNKSTNMIIKLGNLKTEGDTNTFSVCIKNSKLGYDDCIIVMRYRKNIIKLQGENGYKANIVIGIIGIKTSNNTIKFSNHDDLNTDTMLFNYNGKVKGLNIDKEYSKLIRYISKTCEDECAIRSIKISKQNELKNTAMQIGIRSAAVAMIDISCIGLTACGSNNTSVSQNTAIEMEQNYRTYACDYKTLALNTKITTTLNDREVTIKGNIFRIVTDPLKMVDNEGNVLAEATDSYNLISEDDHAIIVNGTVDVVMAGNFDFIGKSYKLYDADGNQIGNFERNKLTSMGAKITDMDGNIIAEYSRGLLMNDFSVTINENDKMSDESVLMIMASFVSDQKAEDSAHSSSSSRSSSNSN